MNEESVQSTAVPNLVKTLADLLMRRRLVVATAESCTGGGIAAALTELAGSSQWFDAGFVTYSNMAKQRMLGVNPNHFREGGPGAVSEQVVLEMSLGAVARSEAEVSMAVSGIAGPTGGSDEKPVGTVWIAWCVDQQADAQCYHFEGDRAAIRQATVATALQGLLVRISGEF